MPETASKVEAFEERKRVERSMVKYSKITDIKLTVNRLNRENPVQDFANIAATQQVLTACVLARMSYANVYLINETKYSESEKSQIIDMIIELNKMIKIHLDL